MAQPKRSSDPPQDLAVARAARDIMAYLRANPEAADALAGVRLWLEHERRLPSLGVIERAMQSLVERGLVSVVDVGPGSPRLYRLRHPAAANPHAAR